MTYYPVDVEESVKKECRRRRFSRQTMKTYLYCINRFLNWSGKELGKISKRDVREFLEYLSDKNLSGNSLNTYHMAIRFLFTQVLDKKMWIDIKYSKVAEKLPIVLSKEEMKKLFDAIDNEKHKLMIKLLYSSGMRVSELIDLKVGDLNIDNGYGFVRQGKGGKDRLFILADKLKQDIINLIGKEKLRHEDCLFTSNRNTKYNIRSLQQIIKRSGKKAKINKKISPHILRHSFATHLIEQGSSISEVQSLLGHKSPETTQIYLHTSVKNMINIKSPLDYL